jgi:hypothetical protein
MQYIYYRIKQLCIKLVIKTSLYYDTSQRNIKITHTHIVFQRVTNRLPMRIQKYKTLQLSSYTQSNVRLLQTETNTRGLVYTTKIQAFFRRIFIHPSIHCVVCLSYYGSVVSSKASSKQSAMYCFLFQFPTSFLSLKFIQ